MHPRLRLVRTADQLRSLRDLRTPGEAGTVLASRDPVGRALGRRLAGAALDARRDALERRRGAVGRTARDAA